MILFILVYLKNDKRKKENKENKISMYKF